MIEMNMEHAKKFFFDRQKVVDAVAKAEKNVLTKIGAFVMRGAKKLIKPPGKRLVKKLKKQHAKGEIDSASPVSKPGDPPFSHTGVLRKLILFVYDPSTKSVVIGPVLANAKSSGQAPRVLEHGGTETIKRKFSTVTATYKARPFMAPALAAEAPKLPAMWANAIVK